MVQQLLERVNGYFFGATVKKLSEVSHGAHEFRRAGTIGPTKLLRNGLPRWHFLGKSFTDSIKDDY